jgi:hypothetical protein
MAATPGPLDPGTLVGNAIDGVEQGLGDVAGPALIVGAAVTALTIGWRFAKRFVKG